VVRDKLKHRDVRGADLASFARFDVEAALHAFRDATQARSPLRASTVPGVGGIEERKSNIAVLLEIREQCTAVLVDLVLAEVVVWAKSGVERQQKHAGVSQVSQKRHGKQPEVERTVLWGYRTSSTR
jgi:hypothetical protein